MKEALLRAIRNWLNANKKIFWKYEVACFYRTYQISIANIPRPSAGDITVLNGRRLMNDDQKNKLCSAIRKACSSKKELPENLDLVLEINYKDGSVNTEVVKSRTGEEFRWKNFYHE